jgi:hypothetical protein
VLQRYRRRRQFLASKGGERGNFKTKVAAGMDRSGERNVKTGRLWTRYFRQLAHTMYLYMVQYPSKVSLRAAGLSSSSYAREKQ